MTNLLIEIFNDITENKWCFNYNGACSTCGMMDVKNALKKYTIDEIIDGFKTLDFEDKELQKDIVNLEKLYSLMTGPYTVWNDRNKIENLRGFWKFKKSDNPYMKRIQASDYDIYWSNWEVTQSKFRLEEEEKQKKAKVRKQYIANLKDNDRNDRENGLRDIMIGDFSELTVYEKLVFMSKDTRHTPRYYPGNIAYHVTQEDVDMLDNYQYENLCKMFHMPIKGSTAWGKFKKRFLNAR